MAYCSTSDVAALTKNLISGGSDFSASTSPTAGQVTAWMTAGCAVIETKLAAVGYGAIPATSAAYSLASQVNSLFTAWLAESSRSNPRTAPGESTRADMFKENYESLLEVLVGLDLSYLGVGFTTTTYAGGISVSDKTSVESDSDRVRPRFVRGMARNKEALEPGPTSSGNPQNS